MRLEQLYRIRFTYPEGWSVSLDGGWEQHLYLAEGSCEGSVTGRFRGANFPQRRTAAGPFVPDLRAVIETDDGASIMFECHGYGRAYPPGRREIVGSVLHLSDSERYRRLNDVVCVCVGEVRATDDPDGRSPDLVIDVAELIWEPVADEEPGRRVLVIGLDPFRVPGPWDPQPVADAIEVGMAGLARLGIDAETCLVGLDGSDDIEARITAALQSRRWDCVVVGGGLRKSEERVDLLESIVALVHHHAPQAEIAFNSTPQDIVGAVARRLGVG